MNFSRNAPPRRAESPEAAAGRLVTSMEEIMGRETALLRAGHCVRAAAASGRVAPLISRLRELNADHPAAVAKVRLRVCALLDLRRRNCARLRELRVRLVAERSRIAEAGRRLQSLAPVYTGRIRTKLKPSRLNASA